MSCHISNTSWRPETTSRWGVQYGLTTNAGHNFKFYAVTASSSALNKCMTAADGNGVQCFTVWAVESGASPLWHDATQCKNSPPTRTTRRLITSGGDCSTTEGSGALNLIIMQAEISALTKKTQKPATTNRLAQSLSSDVSLNHIWTVHVTLYVQQKLNTSYSWRL